MRNGIIMAETRIDPGQADPHHLDDKPQQFLFDALVNAIDRLETIVMQETKILRENCAISLQDFNHQKTQGLLELRRVIRGLEGTRFETEIQERFAHLRAVLDYNLQALKNHLTAIEGITETIIETVKSYESDGTYSALNILDRQQRC
ncbi:hypothetical protein [Beijerinckia indica]|uniref:FlgN family protein n=1 Tax=Beijerinckia indica subsp. indica (strain ATCC 9039 / DSM 1715 / NCIMB 8712) TaxID=395963 RepID=B2IG68_BEII9|nr:hypothetical protein [Beijerinckia indica]ACB97142.1 hypothetical protein Bind_3586 [Beijerinckia indica subsp. indica ATCC 9039]